MKIMIMKNNENIMNNNVMKIWCNNNNEIM